MSKLKTYDNYQSVQYDYVSKLPEGWQLLPNIAIFQERSEKGHENQQLLSVTIGRGVIKQSELEKKDSSTLDKSKYLLVNPGDLVYSMRFRQGASGYSVYKGIVSPACTVLRAKKGTEINPRYFYYVFRTGFYKNYVERFAYGIADGQIPLRYGDFKRMYTIVPPVETQNAIVDYLNQKNEQIQEFISKKERLIELLEEEKDNIINKSITKGINKHSELAKSEFDWIGKYPAHWSILRLRFVGSCQNGISAEGDKFGKGSPFVSYGNVYNNMALPDKVDGLMESSVNERNNYSVLEGDVFFTRTSETIEEIGLASTCLSTIKEAVFAGFLIRFRPKKNLLSPNFSKIYFRSTLHRAYFVKEVDLVTRASLGQDLLKSLPVLLPPLNEQNDIADFVDREIEKREILVQNAKQEIEKAEEYNESLITQVVSGQLMVPELAMQEVIS